MNTEKETDRASDTSTDRQMYNQPPETFFTFFLLTPCAKTVFTYCCWKAVYNIFWGTTSILSCMEPHADDLKWLYVLVVSAC